MTAGLAAGRYAGLACPLYALLHVVARKWALNVLHQLHRAGADHPLRYGQLQRLIAPKITQKELTARLRELERAGLVRRKVHPTVPPQVDYILSEAGRSLMPHLFALSGWVEAHPSQFLPPV